MTESSLALDQESTAVPAVFHPGMVHHPGPGRRRRNVRPPVHPGLPGARDRPVDLAVLQGALDDVVARHELLRTLVIRDADPPYQMVLPPCRVPLEVRDLPPVTGKSRDMVVQELILEAEAGSISAREVPLMKALLCKFDDRDSVLFLTVHHSVSDAWSLQVIFRDLGAFYAARRTGIPAELPQVRQYREYAAVAASQCHQHSRGRRAGILAGQASTAHVNSPYRMTTGTRRAIPGHTRCTSTSSTPTS